ncbi:Glutamate carboxypeptidase [Salix suchowensis]|nr:Glutamate carboxypeptidase [Salix suchowensis]
MHIFGIYLHLTHRYPHGPARSVTSVQRGSVQYLSIYPGDPTTPGYPSYENSTRTEVPTSPRSQLANFLGKCESIERKLDKGGSWEGMDVKLVNKVDKKVTPIWNTMGVIPGFIPNEIVMLGNHRDGIRSWVRRTPVVEQRLSTKSSEGLVSCYEGAGSLCGLSLSQVGTRKSDIREGEITSTAPIGVNPLGSGSDYTVFLQWIGVRWLRYITVVGLISMITDPCGNGGFSSTLHDPVYHYHSVFDSERWQEIYGDPGFSRHVSRVVYINVEQYVNAVSRWPSRNTWLTGSKAVELLGSPFNTTHYVEELDRYLDGHSGHSVCPHFLRKNPLRELREAAKRVYAVNKKLSAFERGFLSEEGIRTVNGYGATTLPGLTEALTFEKNATLAEYEVNRLVTLLDQLAEKIRV